MDRKILLKNWGLTFLYTIGIMALIIALYWFGTILGVLLAVILYSVIISFVIAYDYTKGVGKK